MSEIVRAWKDETYRQNLSVEEQAMLPENPAGGFELTDAELEAVYGARRGEGIDIASVDLCSNGQVCKASAGDQSCVSVGAGSDCTDIPDSALAALIAAV